MNSTNSHSTAEHDPVSSIFADLLEKTHGQSSASLHSELGSNSSVVDVDDESNAELYLNALEQSIQRDEKFIDTLADRVSLPINPLTVGRGGGEVDISSGATQDRRVKYRGVYWNPHMKMWRARIWVNGRNKHIGNFSTAEQAARAFDKEAINYGRIKSLNFEYDDVSSSKKSA